MQMLVVAAAITTECLYATDCVLACKSPVSQRGKEVLKSWLSVNEDEVHAAYEAYEAGVIEVNNEKAYKLFRTALGGTGKSEFSRKFNAIVDDNIQKFRTNNLLFAGSYYQIANKCCTVELDFDLIEDRPIVKCFGKLGVTCMKLVADRRTEKNRAGEINCKKEEVFWYLFPRRSDGISENAMVSLQELKELLNA
jgi:hypothetical protein